MWYGKAEDAGGLTPAKDGNAVHAPFQPPNFTDFQVCQLYLFSPHAKAENTAAGVMPAAVPYPSRCYCVSPARSFSI